MTLTRVSIIEFHKKLLQWHLLTWNLELKLRNLSLQNWNFKFIDNEIFWFCDTILIFFCPFFNLGQNKAPVSLTLRHFQISLICIHVWSYEQIRWKKKKKKEGQDEAVAVLHVKGKREGKKKRKKKKKKRRKMRRTNQRDPRYCSYCWETQEERLEVKERLKGIN